MKKQLQKLTLKTVGWVAVLSMGLIFYSKTIFAQDPEFQGVQFDPNGNIKKATKLTDKSPIDVTMNAVQWTLGMLGLIAVIMIIYGGFTWMTAAGNEERITKAKGVLKAAIIGLIVILLSWAIVFGIFTTTRNVST